jgi:hypothetical protein
MKVKAEVSHDGPQCPFCQAIFTPDENFFYNEYGYNLDCDCGGTFKVQPMCSWTWFSRAITFEEG